MSIIGVFFKCLTGLPELFIIGALLLAPFIAVLSIEIISIWKKNKCDKYNANSCTDINKKDGGMNKK